MKIGSHEDFDKREEMYTKLYIPSFITGETGNDDIVYMGTNKGNIYIYSLVDDKILIRIRSPYKEDDNEVSDIKLC
jgi:hypothetical protein